MENLAAMREQAAQIEIDLAEKQAAFEASTPVFKPTNVRQRVFLTFEDPTYSLKAKWLSSVIMMLIIMGCVIQIMESMEMFQYLPERCDKSAPTVKDCRMKPLRVFRVIEACCMLVFTVEYATRMALVQTVPESVWLRPSKGGKRPPPTWGKSTCPNMAVTYRYGIQYMNMIDVVAILPFWIEVVGLSGGSFGVVRIVRLTRVLRMLKSPSISNSVNVFYESFRASLPALSILFFYTLLAIILVGTLGYIFEQGEFTVDRPDLCCDPDKIGTDACVGCYLRISYDGIRREPSPFTSIPRGMYWVIVTMTTVGYGDLFPTTTPGHFIAVLVTYAGILAIALPISVIGNNFTSHYEKARMEQKQKEYKLLLTKQKVASQFRSVLKNVKAAKGNARKILASYGSSKSIDISRRARKLDAGASAPASYVTPAKPDSRRRVLAAKLADAAAKSSSYRDQHDDSTHNSKPCSSKVHPAGPASFSPLPETSQHNPLNKLSATLDDARAKRRPSNETDLHCLPSVNSSVRSLASVATPTGLGGESNDPGSNDKLTQLAAMVSDLQRSALMQQRTLVILEQQLRALGATPALNTDPTPTRTPTRPPVLDTNHQPPANKYVPQLSPQPTDSTQVDVISLD